MAKGVPCHAIAWSPSGRIPGMSTSHICHFRAKVAIHKAGVPYPICGVHLRKRQHGPYALEVVAERERNAPRIRILHHELAHIYPLEA